MPRKPVSQRRYLCYALQSPQLSASEQLSSCQMWVYNRFSQRNPKTFWDRRCEYKEKLFGRDQGRYLGMDAKRGDMIVFHSPEHVFNSYEDFLQTAKVCKTLGVTIGFVKNRFNLENDGALAELKKEIVRIEAIAIRNMREESRAGKKLPLGYRWADNTDAIIPDPGVRACGALLHMLEERLGMDHAAAILFIGKTYGFPRQSTVQQFRRVNQFRIAFLLGWPDVSPEKLEDLAYRTNPSVLVNMICPPMAQPSMTRRIKLFLQDGFHTIAEMVKHLQRSARTVVRLLHSKPIRDHLIRDISGDKVRYMWVTPAKKPKKPILTPLVAFQTCGVVEPGSLPPPDSSSSPPTVQP